MPHDSVALEPVQGLIQVINGAPRSFPRHANLYGLTELTDPARGGWQSLFATETGGLSQTGNPVASAREGRGGKICLPQRLEASPKQATPSPLPVGGGKVCLPQRPEASPKQATTLFHADCRAKKAPGMNRGRGFTCFCLYAGAGAGRPFIWRVPF